MLNPVKTSPAGGRPSAVRATFAPAASGTVQVSAVGADENLHNDDSRRPPSHERREGGEGKRKAAIDHAIESLLNDAAAVTAEKAARVAKVPDAAEAPAEKHVLVAGLYARHERSDNRDAVLRPGAVFSASF